MVLADCSFNKKGEYYGNPRKCSTSYSLVIKDFLRMERRHGEGMFTYANKDIYSGWWRDGKKAW